ncbi:MAG: hypothetical protein JXR25_04130 [Pontiellaceae bacterium]|nr:hypothetical protein [Pontiellaceae bacterium]MBN2783991.1 hypothetical protein [Pontiellaceae bacterium]
MLRINIIYRNNNMPSEVLPPIMAPDGSYEVVWSKAVQAGFDVVVYFNEYVYNRREHDQVCPDALRFLYMYEPVAVDPMQYTRKIWKQFDAVLTWNTYLTESSDAFTFEPGAYYDLPYCSHYGVTPLSGLPDPSTRETAICQVCGDKYSLSAEEIYSERRKIARWFHRHAETRMDVFGKPAMKTPNYRGVTDDKAATFSCYRYALCFENTFHPLWTRGYLTEKILDCMATMTVPVYFGCSNIEELVPTDCFIDYRRFSSLEELDGFLQAMTDEEYLGYAERMQRFVREYNAPERHSAFRLYETIAAAVKACGHGNAATYPRDYLALSSISGKLRYFAMKALLPHYRVVYPMFTLARWIGSELHRLTRRTGV